VTNGTYYLKASGYNASTTGAYVLSMTATILVVPPTITTINRLASDGGRYSGDNHGCLPRRHQQRELRRHCSDVGGSGQRDASDLRDAGQDGGAVNVVVTTPAAR